MIKKNLHFSGLGDGFDFNIGSIISGYVNQVVANYQAKIGTFLQDKQTLLSLQARCLALAKYSTTQIPSANLLLQVNNALAQQAQYEKDGAAALQVVNAMQNDTIVKAAMAGNLPGITDIAAWSTLNTTVHNAENAKNTVLSWLNNISAHESNITTLTGQIQNLEASVGISPSTGGMFDFLKNVPVGVWIGVGFIGVKFFGGQLIKAVKGKRK